MKDAVLRHYDEKYAGDAAHAGGALYAASATPTNRYQACLLELPRRLPAGGDVLEIAAGSGVLARSLLAAGLRCGSYTATEISDARLAALQSLADPRIRVARLDIEAAPDDHDGRYDAIVLVALIEHLFDPLRAMQRVRRWLKPGGFALIDTPNVAKWTRRAKLLCGRFPSTASRDEGLVTYDGRPVDLVDEGHLHYFTWGSLTRMLTLRCGFSRVEPVPYATGPHPFGTRASYALACALPGLFSELCVVAYA
jgi:SAM-dependent methyltransferase